MRRRSGRCWSGRGRLTYSRIHQILQFLARLEERNLLGGDFHAIAGLGIAADARLALAGAETAEAADLDLVAHPERAHDAVENGFYDHFTVLAGQLRQLGHFIDQISLSHTPLRSVSVVMKVACAWGRGSRATQGLHNLLKFQGLCESGLFW